MDFSSQKKKKKTCILLINNRSHKKQLHVFNIDKENDLYCEI